MLMLMSILCYVNVNDNVMLCKLYLRIRPWFRQDHKIFYFRCLLFKKCQNAVMLEYVERVGLIKAFYANDKYM